LSPTLFRPLAQFDQRPLEYRLLPFRFMRWPDDAVLVTSECGEFEFLPTQTFEAFANHRLGSDDPWYAELKAKHFLADTDSILPLELLATKVRTKRSHLSGFTSLHIMVVSLRCDHSCPYCQVSRVTEDRSRFDMSIATADAALEWIFKSPSPQLKIEFQGGEPTLNWPLIVHVVSAASDRGLKEGRTVDFVIATNLSTINTSMLQFCKEHKIHLSTSLDGPADLHNANRPRPGHDSYERLSRNLVQARAVLGADQVAALMTTTPASLSRGIDIIEEYRSLGFDTVFFRPISPYGFATRTRLDRSYSTEAFLNFYRKGLDYIVDLNRRGVPFVEAYSQILLRKMLTPFPIGYVDLQSPAGAAISVLVYNYDGDVYASDEGRMLAEMGDRSFRLGNLAADDYRVVMSGPRVQALVENSCLETMPGCSECAYAPYCGADPVFNWATQGDLVGFRPTSEFCSRQMGVFAYLFEHLRSGDAFVQRLFLSWAVQ
jgi:uncharacterized protein